MKQQAFASLEYAQKKKQTRRCELSTGYVFEPDRRGWRYQTTTLYERRFK